MEKYGDPIVRPLLTLATMVLCALLFPGCADLKVAEMQAQRQEFAFFVERELQRCKNASYVAVLPPAHPADMEAERRELDRMILSGDWQTLTPLEPFPQAEGPQPSEHAAEIGLSLLMAQNPSYHNFPESTFGVRLTSR